jgi:hypothetical protein
MSRHKLVLVIVTLAAALLGACQGFVEDFSQSADNRIDINGEGLYVSDTGQATIDSVVTARAGWLCIRADEGGSAGRVIGCSGLLPAGPSQNVPVSVDLTGLTSVIYPTLYIDAGKPGVLEVPDPDGPALSSIGSPVARRETLMSDPSWITVHDQPLAGGDTVVVERVYAPVTALLVIHDGRDQHVLGYTPLQIGENSNVSVKLEIRGDIGQVFAELHWDGDNIGKLDVFDPASKIRTGDYLMAYFNITGN